MAAVVVVTTFTGVVTTLGLGLACFHCGGAGIPYVFGGGLLATVGVGALAAFLRRRLLESAVARRRAVSLLAGAGAAILVALGLWNVVFDEVASDEVDRRHLDLDRAIPVAVDAGGRHRWPATAHVRHVGPDRVEVERRWLGLTESTVDVERSEGRWEISGPTTGPGWLAQVVVACVLPSAAGGVTAAWAVHRRGARRAEAAAVPTGARR